MDVTMNCEANISQEPTADASCFLNPIKFSFKRQQGKYYKFVDNMYFCIYENKCEKAFNTEQKIKKHVKSHIFKKKIVCNFPGCGKKFSSMNNLKVIKYKYYIKNLDPF